MNIAQRDRILASVNQVIGRKESVVPNTPENNSHDRLLRISAGLLHLLNEVLPGMANITTPSEQRESAAPSTLETFPLCQEVRHE